MSRYFNSALSQYAEIPVDLSGGGSINFAFSCWFMPFSAAFGVLMATGKQASSGLCLNGAALIYDGANSWANGAGKVYAGIMGGCASNFRYAMSGTAARVNSWNFVGAYFASVNAQDVWLNQGPGVSNNAATSTYTADRTILGAWYNNTNSPSSLFNGLLAEVVVYNTGFPDRFQLSRGVDPFLCVTPGSIVAYWKLLGGASPERDYALKHLRDIPLTNAPTANVHPPYLHYPVDRMRYGFAAGAPAAHPSSFAVIVG